MNRFLKNGFFKEVDARSFTVISVATAEVAVTAVTDNNFCTGGIGVKTDHPAGRINPECERIGIGRGYRRSGCQSGISRRSISQGKIRSAVLVLKCDIAVRARSRRRPDACSAFCNGNLNKHAVIGFIGLNDRIGSSESFSAVGGGIIHVICRTNRRSVDNNIILARCERGNGLEHSDGF